MKNWIDEVIAGIAFSKKTISLDMRIVENAVKNATFLWEDLGFDSLDVMEVIIECEGKAGFMVPNSKIKNIKTKEDLYKLFEKND